VTGRHLALFDLDGTLTTGDTMFAFVRHCRGDVRFVAGLFALAPMLVAHRLGLVSAERAKVLFLGHYFRGWSRRDLAEHAVSFRDKLDAMVRPHARQRLSWHRDAGHEVVVVSASLDLWVRPWAERHGVALLCTEAAFESDAWSGALSTRNCNGAEKVARVRAALALDTYDRIYTYGDSNGDRELLALGHEASFRPFRSVGRSAVVITTGATRAGRERS
jgi:HAD superfamily hydrolase (TIGR01490 family)